MYIQEVMGMIYYAKYHKDGNSFIITECQDIKGESKKALAETLCRQNTKIGADSLIVCDTSQRFISMVCYSKNGMRQPLNGSGIACLAQYCYEYGFLSEKETYIKTDAALVRVKIKKTSPFTTTVYLPPAVFSVESCCMPKSVYTKEIYIETGYGKIPLTTVNTGNIYSVIWLDEQKKWHLNRKGRRALTDDRQYFMNKTAREIAENSIFRLKTGVVFAEIIEYNTIALNIYDKNASYLSSCLTAEAAAAVCALEKNRCSGSNIVSGNTNFHISCDGIIQTACITHKASEGFVSADKK